MYKIKTSISTCIRRILSNNAVLSKTIPCGTEQPYIETNIFSRDSPVLLVIANSIYLTEYSGIITMVHPMAVVVCMCVEWNRILTTKNLKTPPLLLKS